jgi:hypothetical protein
VGKFLEQRAILIAREVLIAGIDSGDLFPDDGLLRRRDRVLSFLRIHRETGGPIPQIADRYPWEDVVRDATERKDGAASAACLMFAADELEAGRMPPRAIAIYAASRLRSGPGKERFRKSFTNEDRNLRIASAVYAVSQGTGIAIDRNEATETDSACTIVSRVLRELGLPLSEETIENIWHSNKARILV